MSRERDTQRSKVYAAEREAFGYTFYASTKPGVPLSTCETFIRKVESSAYVLRKYPKGRFSPPHVNVHSGAGNRRATANYREIKLPLWSRTKPVMLHELAHVYTPKGPWHGWEFCATYLDLVRHFLGKAEHDLLKAAFKKNKVRFTAPRQKSPTTMAPEAREAMLERMTALRAAKTAKAASEKGSA